MHNDAYWKKQERRKNEDLLYDFDDYAVNIYHHKLQNQNQAKIVRDEKDPNAE